MMQKLLILLVAFGVFLNAAQAEAAAYSAANVLGQANFTSGTAATTQSGMSLPAAVAYDSANKRLFVADMTNRRVLVFDLTTISDGEAAVNVLGQADFISGASALAQNRLSNPSGLSYDATNQRLYVADSANNRVLMFDVASISDGENAALVLGQANFTTATAATTQGGMSGPKGVLYDATNNRLFVADGDSNNRVLVFNDASSLTNGANASSVLGQANFTSGDAGLTANNMDGPFSLAFDATNNRLFVAESSISNIAPRVLVFDVAAITNGEAAVNVLGQPTFTSSDVGITKSRFNDSLVSVAYDSSANYLFVSGFGEHRVMIFDVASITNGEDAVNVLGQANFTSSSFATSQTGLKLSGNPHSAAYDATNNRLFVPDGGNNRVLIYNFVRITDASYANGTNGSAYSQSITTTASQGTVSYAVASGALPTGLSISSGSITGTPSAAGDYAFTLRATDAFDTGNFLYTSGSFTLTIAAASGGAYPPLQFAEQQRRIASRLAPVAPNSIRASSPSCTPERCPVELRFTYAPLPFHRSRATRFVFYDDRNRPITSLTALPASVEEYKLTIPINGANSAISGRLCAVVATQESCTLAQGFADIVLDSDTFAWSDELLDATREEYRLSFRTAKLPANYSVGKTKATVAVYEDNETARVIIERAVTFAPHAQMLVPAIRAGSYIVRITPQSAEGKVGASIEQRITVPLSSVAEKAAAPSEGVNEAISEALSRLGELLRAILQLISG